MALSLAAAADFGRRSAYCRKDHHIRARAGIVLLPQSRDAAGRTLKRRNWIKHRTELSFRPAIFALQVESFPSHSVASTAGPGPKGPNPKARTERPGPKGPDGKHGPKGHPGFVVNCPGSGATRPASG